MLYTPSRARPLVDPALFWSTLLLCSIGLVMVYSASITMSEAIKLTGYRPHYFLMRHSAYLVIAGIVAAVAFQLPITLWQKLAPWLFAAGGFLLLLVLIPKIGIEINGSRRWLPLGVSTMQPSEVMKFLAVLYAADYTVRKAAFMHDVKKGFLPMFAVMCFIGGLLLREPDFGALVVVSTIAVAILFLGGLNWRIFAALMVALPIAFYIMILVTPYRYQRLIGFLDPWADQYGKGYQLSHSLIAFGRGEWFGVGLGASVEKLFYLPEAHTDFLLAVIGEELGFAGVAVVLMLFGVFVFRAFAIGREAMAREKYFAALVAQGIAVWIAAQAMINMGVNLGWLPTKGLTLPFLSFGGTGIIMNAVAVAVLLRIDYENYSPATKSRTVRSGGATNMSEVAA